MIKKLDYETLNEFKANNSCDFVINENISGKDCSFYEIIAGKKKIGLVKEGLKTPKTDKWKNKILLLTDTSIYFIDEKTGKIIKKITFSVSVYEFLIENDLVYIFSELQIIILDDSLKIIKCFDLGDILTDYKIKNNFLIYKTDDGIEHEEKIF